MTLQSQAPVASSLSVLEEFRWRGMVHRTEDGKELFTPGLEELLAKEKVTAYIGFDPSADSLHVGNLFQIMNLVRMQRFGHHPIAIVGGGTGLIGDPSGKTAERQLLTREGLSYNLECIREQLSRYLDFGSANAAHLVNNADWLDTIKLMDFLREVGKHFTVNYMLAKDSVQGRMTGGISFTEFSYMLLQAYDYYMLHQRYGCNLQMGGSDQWGNITAGIDLIRRLTGQQAHALVTPLITTASGAKFGKTEAGAVWLDAKKTSPFKFYQFWYNTPDADAVRYLCFFTRVSREEMAQLEAVTAGRPERREAQTRLADEVTRMTHGEAELQKAKRASAVLFGGDIAGLTATELLEVFEDVPSVTIPRQRLEGEGVALVDLLEETGLAPSRAEARRLVQSGGVSLNSRRIADVRRAVTLSDAVEGRVVVVKRGGREHRLVRVEG